MKLQRIVSSVCVLMCILGVLMVPVMTSAQRTCATMEVHEHLLQTDPNYRANRAAIEEATQKYIEKSTLRPSLVTIPVVVHVVYNTVAQNISDAQIASQIRILNEDFRKLNSDVSSVPSVFQPYVADARIQFALACKDPSGNPTTGITRTATSTAQFPDDSVKYTAQGGHDAWPRDKYLNLWVANLSGGLLGYAQFPGGPAATDGVVIVYTAFGDIGTAAYPYNKGRTATHEIGHWLNLYHIWGDDTGDPDECAGTDLVADTPNQADEHYGTPTFPQISCGNGPNGDMFMNYMDYVDDIAMFMFTSGQSVRIDAVLDGSRLLLVQSDGLACSNSYLLWTK